ncbi:transposase [Candidatus Poribacteria bacterium]|nr:transposase [Candidatus Poribacteria bacterium]
MNPVNVFHKQYEALRSFFVEKIPAKNSATQYGYTLISFYSLVKNFKKSFMLNNNQFFALPQFGRKPIDNAGKLNSFIVEMRKKFLSIPDIKSSCDVLEMKTSEKHIYNVIKKNGFARLPRRDYQSKEFSLSCAKLNAPSSYQLDFSTKDHFSTQNSIGVLSFIPLIKRYGIDKIINETNYPETRTINKLSSILSFVCLKLSNIKRYNADDIWCNDRGLGLFAGLNVLPKTAWFSSYSSRITRKMNQSFLKKMHSIWQNNTLLSDTINFDFTTIPYWGDDSALENNWSGKRGKALSGMLAALAQDPDSGIIDYTDTTVRHNNESNIVLEFLDFYKSNTNRGENVRYIVFDSKVTPFKNLKKIDEQNIKFITIRRRGAKLIERIHAIPKENWKRIHVMNANGKGRTIKVVEEYVVIKEYGKEIRQLIITGHGKIKPAIIISNDYEISKEDLVRKYAKRWIIEKSISEQIDFFHLNRVSSSMVIKVDFDLCMTVLAYNLYRLLGLELSGGYSHTTAQTIFNKFIYNSGFVNITDTQIIIEMKKKRNLPLLLSALTKYEKDPIPWMNNLKLKFSGASTT